MKDNFEGQFRSGTNSIRKEFEGSKKKGILDLIQARIMIRNMITLFVHLSYGIFFEKICYSKAKKIMTIS